LKYGNISATSGTIWSNNTGTPSATNYAFTSDGATTVLNSSVGFCKLESNGYAQLSGNSRVALQINATSVIYSEATTALALCGGSYTAAQITCGAALVAMAGTTARAGFRLTPGVAPTSPVNGDMWCDATDVYIRIGATTYTITKV
jgi:hypothetical protein